METMGGLPFAWLEFDKKGKLKNNLPGWSTDGTISDVVIISHGWKTDRVSAVEQYEPVIKSIVGAWSINAPAKPAGKSFAVLGVLWPSKAYDANYGEIHEGDSGGAANTEAGANMRDLTDTELETMVAAFSSFTEQTDTEKQKLLADARRASKTMDSNACQDFLERALAAVSPANDSETKKDTAIYNDESAKALLEKLAAPPLLVAPTTGAGMGLGESIGEAIAGAKAAVGRLLNQLTFFEMKTRAGVVGSGLANSALASIQNGRAQRIHLIGHSFGARLVTSAVYSAARSVPKLRSLSLLQGAFSHNAMSKSKKGAFAEAYNNVPGITLITHTHNDSAVTKAYAIASRLSRDNAKKLGDKNDQFGAIGSNGALFIDPAKLVEHAAFPTVALTPAAVNNVLADAFIADHMDIARPETGKLLAQTIST